MPPRRPFTDLCLIAVFKQLKPNNQLKANKISPRCAILIRAANRRVKSLVIANSEDLRYIKRNIGSFLLASRPSMKQLKVAGESFLDYPMTSTPLSKWNCLILAEQQELHSSAIEQIVNIFSAVIDLKFIRGNEKTLVALLQQPEWTNQLTNLMYTNGYDCDSSELFGFLITAINRLSALQYLAFTCYDYKVPDMTILNQLKVIAISYGSKSTVSTFLRSLQRHATKNINLQVHFLLAIITEVQLDLSEPLRSRVVRHVIDCTYDKALVLCRQFPSLISLRTVDIKPPQLRPLFTALSQLQQLVHLELNVDLTRSSPEEFHLLAKLPSVRALDLLLTISSHSQVQWLNLQWTLPNCQAIHVKGFYCTSCEDSLSYYLCYLDDKYNEELLLNLSKNLECLRASFSNLHSGVHPGRIILCGEIFTEKPYYSLEQIMFDD